MSYWLFILIGCLTFYPLSYARYNWNRNNKFGALGVLLLVLMSVLLPLMLLMRR